ncbi:unannotated protein [freshwater metagenome]|uniref:Unannotated protein n=1 Tax=freshwater metagenome TaxID=449393 RepID=A0A6J6XAN1_9ZZZZ
MLPNHDCGLPNAQQLLLDGVPSLPERQRLEPQTSEPANKGQGLRQRIQWRVQNHRVPERGRHELKSRPRATQKHREPHRVVPDRVRVAQRHYQVHQTNRNQIQPPAIAEFLPIRQTSDRPFRHLSDTTLRRESAQNLEPEPHRRASPRKNRCRPQQGAKPYSLRVQILDWRQVDKRAVEAPRWSRNWTAQSRARGLTHRHRNQSTTPKLEFWDSPERQSLPRPLLRSMSVGRRQSPPRPLVRPAHWLRMTKLPRTELIPSRFPQCVKVTRRYWIPQVTADEPVEQVVRAKLGFRSTVPLLSRVKGLDYQ